MVDSTKIIEGVCCVCHGTFPVRSMSERELDEEGFDPDFDDRDQTYVMADHFPFFKDQKCAGTGQVPQVVLRR